MKNLIIISNLEKADFEKVTGVKKAVDSSTIQVWTKLPFLKRLIIITHTEPQAGELYDFLCENQYNFGLISQRIYLKENYLTGTEGPDLKVDDKIDLNYENKLHKRPELKIDTAVEVNNQLPSPTITIDSFE